MTQNHASEYDVGVDVAHLLGTDKPCLERDLFEIYQAHFKRARADPSVPNFRLCVEAHDAFLNVFHTGL